MSLETEIPESHMPLGSEFDLGSSMQHHMTRGLAIIGGVCSEFESTKLLPCTSMRETVHMYLMAVSVVFE